MALGRVVKVIDEVNIQVYSIEFKKEIGVEASRNYVSSIKVELQDTDKILIVEYDLDSKIINENIDV